VQKVQAHSLPWKANAATSNGTAGIAALNNLVDSTWWCFYNMPAICNIGCSFMCVLVAGPLLYTLQVILLMSIFPR
jgi:hypothetical protein